MKITSKSMVGDIVAENYKTAEIFTKHKIGFCCGGQQTIEEAYENQDMITNSIEALVVSLNDFFEFNTDNQTEDYTKWPLDDLADHIEKKHHNYVESKIPLIKEYLDKIESIHGEDHPELQEINSIFKASAGELVVHMKKEELILFPFIRRMAIAGRAGGKLKTPPFGSIKFPISKMDEEHNSEGEAFQKIALLSGNYSIPEGACNSYNVAFEMLKEFEEDLHLHIHKENNILFQRAIELEKKLLFT